MGAFPKVCLPAFCNKEQLTIKQSTAATSRKEAGGKGPAGLEKAFEKAYA
jgi:hypothetical protein